MNNSEFTAKFNSAFAAAFAGIEAYEGENKIAYDVAIEKCVNLVLKAQKDNKKIMFAGNGGSAGSTL